MYTLLSDWTIKFVETYMKGMQGLDFNATFKSIQKIHFYSDIICLFLQTGLTITKIVHL